MLGLLLDGGPVLDYMAVHVYSGGGGVQAYA